MGQLLTEEIGKFIGLETELKVACDPVERGAVRRFAQAIMDLDPVYMHEDAVRDTRYQKPVAPPLFPLAMMRADFDAPDAISERASDPDFDGLDARMGSYSAGLPELPRAKGPVIYGGTEVEVFRLVHHGERVQSKARYFDIYERETSKGPRLFVVIEIDFLDMAGNLVCRQRKTQIRT